MKILHLKSAHCISEEGGSGTSEYPELPCQMVVASQYISDLGFNVTMRDVFCDEEAELSFGDFDVAVVWVPIIGPYFHTSISYLERAKKAGCVTVMILNDAYENMEQECLERYAYIDFAIRLNEREIVLGQLLQRLRNNEKYCDLRGLIYRDGGHLVNTGLHPMSENLHHLRASDRFLSQLPLDRYHLGKVEGARGCPYPCTFCQYNLTKRRARRVEDIVAELRVLEGRYHKIWVHELNMMIDKEFTREFCEAIINAGLNVPWATDAHMATCRDLDLLVLMKKSGCIVLDFGLECVNEEIRMTHIRKKVSDETIDVAVNNCLAAGIQPSINLMVGSPWDSPSVMKETEGFIQRYPYVDNIQLCRPQQGTPLYESFRKEGLLVRDLTLDDYVTSRDYPACPTKYMGQEELYRWFWRLSIKIISRHAVERLRRIGLKKFVQQVLAKKFKPYYIRVVFEILKKKMLAK